MGDIHRHGDELKALLGKGRFEDIREDSLKVERQCGAA
jgi:hypothetical protein